MTIERSGNIAPYSVIIGVYGLMFHTYFAETEGKAKRIKEISIRKIDEILSHNKIALSEREMGPGTRNTGVL